MGRVAFKMWLKEGVFEEYTKRHDEIWPELVQLLKDNDISDYTIFMDTDRKTLFAIQSQGPNYNEMDLKSHPIMRKWWDYMADLMEVEEDHAPTVSTLNPVFYLE